MSENNHTKNCNGALEKLDSPAQVSLAQLGQFQYSFFVDQVPNTVANTQATSITGPSASEPSWIHPSEETRLKESKSDPTVKYQNEFTERCLQAAAEASIGYGDERSDELTIAGAVERQVKAGFSAQFNFLNSLERIFDSLDGNGDRRLSKEELDFAYADGRFNGDDELLLILLLRHLNDLRSLTGARDVTYEDIASYPGWRQYFTEPSTFQQKKFLRQRT